MTLDPTLFADAPQEVQLTDGATLERIAALAESIESRHPDRASLDRLEAALFTLEPPPPLSAHLAVKLAKSRRILRDLNGPLHISVICPLYREHTRILTQEEHPHGEDFLRKKIAQMKWLFDGQPEQTWDLTLVDDGCPDQSGHIAARLIAEEFPNENIQALFLQGAIRQKLPCAAPMLSTGESQKGGSVQYGLWEMSRKVHDRHILVYTDADLSTHLGQIGLLADAILNRAADVAIGSRREPLSVQVKSGVRNNRGKLFIYLWKRLLPLLTQVVDTQCGFKAFHAEALRHLINDTKEKKFAFDIELLIKAEQRRPGCLEKSAIAWIDSEAASTTTDLEPYLPMLKSIAGLYRHYLPQDPEADAFADFIDRLDTDDWNALVENIPAAIADREPADFADFAEVSVGDLESAIAQK